MSSERGSSVGELTDEELAETVVALRERVADLEAVVAAVGDEVGIASAWLSCPECVEGVVLVGDRRAACTNCGYALLC